MMALCEIGTMKEATLGKRMKRLEGQKRRKKNHTWMKKYPEGS